MSDEAFICPFCCYSLTLLLASCLSSSSCSTQESCAPAQKHFGCSAPTCLAELQPIQRQEGRVPMQICARLNTKESPPAPRKLWSAFKETWHRRLRLCFSPLLSVSVNSWQPAVWDLKTISVHSRTCIRAPKEVRRRFQIYGLCFSWTLTGGRPTVTAFLSSAGCPWTWMMMMLLFSLGKNQPWPKHWRFWSLSSMSQKKNTFQTVPHKNIALRTVAAHFYHSLVVKGQWFIHEECDEPFFNQQNQLNLRASPIGPWGGGAARLSFWLTERFDCFTSKSN